MKKRVVVAYAGGEAATRAVRTLVAAGAEVVTLTVDLGQGRELEQVRDAALAAGAVRAHVVDARDEFARDYVLPVLRAGVRQGGWLSLVRTLSAPLVAAKLREIARIEGAAVDTTVPSDDVDATLAGRVVSDTPFKLTTSAAAAPASPAMVVIRFERDVPVAINDIAMPLTELFESLSLIAGQHGVGRVDDVEAPAAVVLQTGLQVQDNGVARMKLFRGACELVSQVVSPHGDSVSR
jgi:argininosuccinate synthase